MPIRAALVRAAHWQERAHTHTRTHTHTRARTHVHTYVRMHDQYLIKTDLHTIFTRSNVRVDNTELERERERERERENFKSSRDTEQTPVFGRLFDDTSRPALFFFFFKWRLTRALHALGQYQSTVAQRAETTVARVSSFPDMFPRYARTAHSQPTPTPLGQRCLCVFV